MRTHNTRGKSSTQGKARTLQHRAARAHKAGATSLTRAARARPGT